MTKKSGIEETLLKKQISNTILNVLDQKKLSQVKLSKLTGIPKTTISSYIRGISIPSLENIQKINEVLNTSINIKRRVILFKEDLDEIIKANNERINNEFVGAKNLNFEEQKECVEMLIDKIDEDINSICVLKEYLNDFIEERLYWYFVIKMEGIKIEFMKLVNDEFGMTNTQYITKNNIRQKIIDEYNLMEYGVFY